MLKNLDFKDYKSVAKCLEFQYMVLKLNLGEIEDFWNNPPYDQFSKYEIQKILKILIKIR